MLLVRTGQLRRRNEEGPADPTEGSTACQAACLPLLHERGVAMLGSDTGNRRLAGPTTRPCPTRSTRSASS